MKNKNNNLIDYLIKLYNTRIIIFLTLVIILFLIIVNIFYIAITIKEQNKIINFPEIRNYSDFINIIEQIERNCDSVYITRCLNDDKGKWCVFSSECKTGNYCKHKYYPINECLD